MTLLSLDRHDVLETIRQSNSLHEAFLRVAKLPAVGEYRTATNADRIRDMTDEELAEFIAYSTSCETCPVRKGGSDECHNTNCSTAWLDWLREEVTDG